MLDKDDLDLMETDPRSLDKVIQLYVAMLKEQLTVIRPHIAAQKAAAKAETDAAVERAKIAAQGQQVFSGVRFTC